MGCLWVSGRLPGLNDIIEQSAGASSGWSKYNQTKQAWSANIGLLAAMKGVGAIPPGYFTYLFAEPNCRRDPSNVVAGGVKLIEDALQAAKLLKNDGWTDVLGFCGYWIKKPERVGTLVHWNPDGCVSKDTMIALMREETEGNANQKAGNGPRNSVDAAGSPNPQGAPGAAASARR